MRHAVGLGAVLQQERQPISYASRCMTSAEQNYAHIEKVWPEIQRSGARDFDYQWPRRTIWNLRDPLTADTGARIEKIRAAMQVLIRTIQSGWPNERRRCTKQIPDFWPVRDELAIVDNESLPLVVKGHRMVIPFEQREEILQQLHIGHFGIEKTKQRASDAVYWPHLNTDIEMLIRRCSICQEHQWAPQNEPMMNRPIPTRPFRMVAVDLFECDVNNYHSLQDYYSRYIELESLYSTRT